MKRKKISDDIIAEVLTALFLMRKKGWEVSIIRK